MPWQLLLCRIERNKLNSGKELSYLLQQIPCFTTYLYSILLKEGTIKVHWKVEKTFFSFVMRWLSIKNIHTSTRVHTPNIWNGILKSQCYLILFTWVFVILEFLFIFQFHIKMSNVISNIWDCRKPFCCPNDCWTKECWTLCGMLTFKYSAIV